MKILLSVFFAVLTCNLLQAQGSLQFNEVKLLTATSNNTTFTVPANKVWKVETAGVSTSSSAWLSISINGVSYHLMPSISSDQGRFQLRLPPMFAYNIYLLLISGRNGSKFATKSPSGRLTQRFSPISFIPLEFEQNVKRQVCPSSFNIQQGDKTMEEYHLLFY